MYALFPQETDAYIAEVELERKKNPNLQDRQQNVDISEEFIDELLKHDYRSKKKGRGTSSIFLNKVGKGKTYKKNGGQQMHQQYEDAEQINSQRQAAYE